MKTNRNSLSESLAARLQRHVLNHDGPAEDFFEGALLGNGAAGCVATTRPDAIHFFFGHNDVWDRRVPEPPISDDDTFAKVLGKLKALPEDLPHLCKDPWFQEHFDYNFSRYHEIYPRPFPCGSVLFGFDRRKTEVIGHELHLADGLLRIHLLHEGAPLLVEAFLDAGADRLHLRVTDGKGHATPHPFVRVALYPDPSTITDFPAVADDSESDDGRLMYRQEMTSSERDSSAPDGMRRYFLELRLAVNQEIRKRRIPLNVNHPVRWESAINPDLQEFTHETPPLEKYFSGSEPLEAVIELRHGRMDQGFSEPRAGGIGQWEATLARSTESWAGFWSASEVELEDSFLEALWYRNQYFLNCVLRSGATCPGIFGHWMFREVGTKWHGDYHLNYNTQQLFWGTFSSNHPEKHLPFVELVEQYLFPLAKDWAREYYSMRGACFPYCAVPVDMAKPLLLGADWSWGVGISAWVAQSFWWHYLYSGDLGFLKQRAFPVIKAVTEFLVDYLSRSDCRGEEWGDDRVHVFPSLSQELYRMRPGLVANRDAITDLAMIRYLFNAFREASDLVDEPDRDLSEEVGKLLGSLAPYPRNTVPEGEVFVSVPGESPETIHNAPQPLIPVFPCNEIGLGSSPEDLETARRTFRYHRNEGGNDLVFLNLQAARLGILDLERFKRQVRYCQLPNGTCTDMNLIAGGRCSPFHWRS